MLSMAGVAIPTPDDSDSEGGEAAYTAPAVYTVPSPSGYSSGLGANIFGTPRWGGTYLQWCSPSIPSHLSSPPHTIRIQHLGDLAIRGGHCEVFSVSKVLTGILSMWTLPRTDKEIGLSSGPGQRR